MTIQTGTVSDEGTIPPQSPQDPQTSQVPPEAQPNPESAQPPATNTPPAAPTGTNQLATDQATQVPASQPMTQERLAELASEYASSGTLSEESMTQAKAAFGDQVVDQYMAGIEAQTQLHVNQVFAAAGGQQQYQQLAQWVASNVTPGERQAFDAAVDSRDTNAALAAVNGMSARMAQSVGIPPTDGLNATRMPAGPMPYATDAEMQADIQNPLYHEESPRGEAFRQQVLNRVAAGVSNA